MYRLRALLTHAALLLTACALCGASATSRPAAPLEDDLQQRIETQVARLMDEQRIPGVALGIIRDGQVVYARGFGVTNVDTGQAVTAQTLFQLSSVSKVMLGIALMQLEVAGRVELDAPLTRYLPYFRTADPRDRAITLRLLLTHSSGLPYCSEQGDCHNSDYRAPQYDAGALERHLRTLDAVRLERDPGSQMSYSDLGFELLGGVIAKVSGQSFEAYVSEQIFRPLGMTHSTFLLSDVPPALLAAPHVGETAPVLCDFYPYSRQHAPSSHLFSTIDDMNRFALAQLDRGRLDGVRILPATAYETLWHGQIATTIESLWERQLGLGWFVGGRGSHRLVGHEGQDTGYGSELIIAPDDGMAVIVLANRQYSLEAFALQIIGWLLDEAEPHQPG